MTFNFNVPGKKRKELAQSVSTWLEEPMSYQGAPTFAYKVGGVTIGKDGSVDFAETMNEDTVERLLEYLFDENFEYEMENTEPEEPIAFTLAVPFDKVNVGNLTNLLNAKGDLIKKALGIETIPIEMTEDSVKFPWFSEMPDPDEVKAYTHLICSLCEMSKEQKRINANTKEIDNEKYAFRCFLLRLGFIGAEYKSDRKILLRNLSGSSAFKSGQKRTEEPQQNAPIPEVDWNAENREDAVFIAEFNAEMDGGVSDAIPEQSNR